MDDKDWFFCSYMALENGSVTAYGDLVFDGVVRDCDSFLGDVKDGIINKHYQGRVGVSVVITALNRLN